MKEKLYTGSISAVILGGSLIRVWMSVLHFTNCDDLGVAVTMLMGEKGGWSLENCIRGLEHFLLCQWTYAPLQFVFTCLLIHPEQTYQQVVVLGRLPSLICGIAALPLLYFLLKRIFAGEEGSSSGILFSVILLATSFEHIIYSAQMNSYAIGVLSVIISMYLFVINRKNYKEWPTAIMTAVLCYAQWQMFLFVFGFYVVMLCGGIRRKEKKICLQVIRSGIMAVCLNLLNLKYFLNCGMQERGTNWNVGTDGQYLFHLDVTEGVLDRILYFVTFWKNNVIECFSFLLLPCGNYHMASMLAVMLIALTLVGMVMMHKGSSLQKQVVWHMDLVVVLYFILILFGRLTLSPSRHLLVMVPFILICLAKGWQWLVSFRSQVTGFCIGSICLVVGLFLIELPEQVELRKNRFHQEYWQKVMDTYQPDLLITYAYSMDAFLVDTKGYSVEMDDYAHCLLYSDDFDFQPEGIRIVLFSNTMELNEELEGMALNLLTEKLKQHDSSDNYKFRVEEEHIESWGITVEYADRFDNGIYGEYVYTVEVERQPEK